jgi:phage FluMu protein Com
MDILHQRNCPACNCNLVDAEISDPIKKFCEKDAFHSKLIGGRDLGTGQITYWKCPECKTVYT